MIVRFNILCLVAAVVGLMGLLLPWVTTTQQVTDDESNWFVDNYAASFGRVPPEYGLLVWVVIGALAVIAGTAITFTTPLGGIVQMAGIVMTLLGGYMGDDPYFFDSPAMATREPGIGIYVVAIGAVMAVISIAIPVFVGTKKSPGLRDERLVAWTVGRGK